jgi:hypothetical protein
MMGTCSREAIMSDRRRSVPRVHRPRRLARLLLGVALGSLAALALTMTDAAGQGDTKKAAAAQGGDAKQAAAKKKDASTKLAEAWPDAAKMEKRRLEAENLPLFKSTAPLVFTLTADFRTIGKDRAPNSTKRYPGVLAVAGDDGKMASIPVQLGTRGNLRLSICGFLPLRIEFPKKDLAGTPFDGQGNLKLVVHCKNTREYDQYVLGEYVAYEIFNIFTPLSYRARLARATYVDSVSNKPIATRYAVFVEHDDDVAKRVNGRIIPLEKRLFRHLDPDSTVMMALLQYMIANTDYSIYTLHNIRLVQNQAGAFSPITYDFDLGGLINTPYGAPDPQLGLSSIRERLYRGPCRRVEGYEPFLVKFRERKADVMALYDAIPDFDKDYKKTARDFLEEFYTTINKKGDLKHELVDRCPKLAGM